MLCRDVEEKRYSSTYYLPCYYLKQYGQWHAQPLHCQGKSLLTNAIGGTTGDRRVAKMLILTENGDLVGWGQLLLILILQWVNSLVSARSNISSVHLHNIHNESTTSEVFHNIIFCFNFFSFVFHEGMMVKIVTSFRRVCLELSKCVSRWYPAKVIYQGNYSIQPSLVKAEIK
jgi:hypothetical protein